MVAFTYRMPAGIPGAVGRAAPDATVEQQLVSTANPPTAFGVPVVMDATTQQIRGFLSGDAGTAVYGFLVRPYPGQETTGYVTGTQYGADAFGSGPPPTTGLCNVMVRGYIDVQLNGTIAAVKNAPVWVRVGGAVTGKPIGGVEGGVDPVTASNTVQLTGAYFTGAADSSGNTEVRYNL